MKSFVKNTLHEAGQLLLSSLGEKKVIGYKDTNGICDYNQILTEQDLLIENHIIQKINDKFPNTNIISEEKAENNFSIENPTWIIDPIDGSANFYRGLNFFCISLSYWENKEPIFAGVYSPYNRELFYSEKGKGSTLNNQRIYVSEIDNLNEAIILISGFESFKKQKKEKEFSNFVSAIKNMRVFSSSILDICNIAAGRCDARILSNCKFWDLSAAKLILEEAGGIVTDWDGKENHLFNPMAIASNKKIHSHLINLVHHV